MQDTAARYCGERSRCSRVGLKGMHASARYGGCAGSAAKTPVSATTQEWKQAARLAAFEWVCAQTSGGEMPVAYSVLFGFTFDGEQDLRAFHADGMKGSTDEPDSNSRVTASPQPSRSAMRSLLPRRPP